MELKSTLRPDGWVLLEHDVSGKLPSKAPDLKRTGVVSVVLPGQEIPA